MINFPYSDIVLKKITYGESNFLYEAHIEINNESFFCIGKTKKEAIDGLKRQVVNRIFQKK